MVTRMERSNNSLEDVKVSLSSLWVLIRKD